MQNEQYSTRTNRDLTKELEDLDRLVSESVKRLKVVSLKRYKLVNDKRTAITNLLKSRGYK